MLLLDYSFILHLVIDLYGSTLCLKSGNLGSSFKCRIKFNPGHSSFLSSMLYVEVFEGFV
jgi:hypothetical protein